MDTKLKVYFKNENLLYLFVPGKPEHELIPTEKNRFSLKVLDGYKIEFLEKNL